MTQFTKERIKKGILAKLKERKVKITDSPSKIREALKTTVLSKQLIARALELRKEALKKVKGK